MGKDYARGVRIWVCMLLVFGLTTTSMAARQSAGPQIFLQRGTFDLRSEPAITAASLAAAQPDLWIVQFRGPVGPQERGALMAQGLKIIDYIPDYAYLVQGAPDAIKGVEALPRLYAWSPLRVADKFSPLLLQALLQGSYDRAVPLSIWPWPGREAAMAAEFAAAGIDPTQSLDADAVQQVAAFTSVRWIEPRQQLQLLNDEARTITGVNALWETVDLYGAGQVVAVADSGFDTGDTNHPDFAGRIIATQVLSAGGDLADEYGHGTHVIGSVGGAGVLSGADPAQGQYSGSFAGMAPQAKFVIQAFETSSSGGVLGLSEDTYPMFALAYSETARIHTNSWGGIGGVPLVQSEQVFGSYPMMSARTDAFVWDHPDMTIFFAAGNSGNDGLWSPFGCFAFLENDGVVDEDSLQSPGTAKNVITVGASESLQSSGGLSSRTWNSSCFPEEPIASDTTSDDPNGLAAFSSRGPTDDGRMKPDLVAPGTNIISNRSREPGANELWGDYPANSNYTFAGGTSMATPLTAGAGALIREWLIGQGIANPSAAAVKATLLNTTRNIAPGQYGTGATQEIPFTRPNYAAGWGRLDLGFITAPVPYQIWIDDQTSGLSTGQSVSYEHSQDRPLTVVAGDQPLRVMLVWTDPPAAPLASKTLVNDLDLKLTGPDGRVYWGNGKTSADRVDNVEGIVIEAPLQGTYRITVEAHNIAQDVQPYALVVAGALGEPTVPPTATATPTSQPDAPTPTSTPSPTPTTLPTPTNRRLFFPIVLQ
jgi:serine protease AprX